MTGGRVGVCSWSLQPDSAEDLIAKTARAGIGSIQIALDPLRNGTMDRDALRNAASSSGIGFISGMMAMAGEDYSTLESIARTGGVRPDATWDTNLEAARANALLAHDLGLRLVTFHAGFIPHDPADVERTKMMDRLRRLADVFGAHDVRVGFETGQESAETLIGALDELAHPNIGVNFDPANMILYAMGDPVAALRSLARHVVQIHIKDAIPTETPGTWGREQPAGSGAVDWNAFFGVVASESIESDYVIEREAGGSRLEDVISARDLVVRLTEAPS